MKIKEVALNEIHWSLPWNAGKQANDRLRQLLGENTSQYFARCSVGAAFYAWNVDTNARWTPLTKAEPSDEILVRKRLEEIKQEVCTKLGATANMTEKILQVPNEEYIFYTISEAGQVQVVITGWGFLNFKKPPIDPYKVVNVTSGSHPVTIAFTIDDEKVPNRDFFIVAQKKNTPHTTDGEGNYPLGKIAPDTALEFIDGPTGRHFNILTDRTTAEYTFDITERITIRVEASHDNLPISDEEATIEYHGKTYQLMLQNGQASASVAYYPDEPCVARFRDAMQQQVLNQAGHTFHFDSMTPVAPPPAPEPPAEEPAPVMPHLFIQGDKGYIGKEYPVTVEYEGTVTSYISDADGIIALPQMMSGQTMTVTDGYNPGNITTYTLEKDQEEYIFHVPYEPVEDARDIKLQYIDLQKRPIAKCGVNFKQSEKERINKLDERGFTYLANETFQPAVPLTSIISHPSRKFPPITFTLDEGETDYLIQEVKGEQGFGDYLPEILAALGAFVGLIIAFLAGGFIIDKLTLFLHSL